MEKIIGNNYKIINKLGGGSFGSVFKGYNINSKDEVIIKCEKINSFKLLKK